MKDIKTSRKTEIKADRNPPRQTYGHQDIHTYIHTIRHTSNRHPDIQKYRWIDNQIEIKTDNKTHRHPDIYPDRKTYI